MGKVCDCMKRFRIPLALLLAAAVAALSFFAGNDWSRKEHLKDRARQFDKYISIAIGIVEEKGLVTDGAKEAIASNLWVAHELCDDPEISAELSNLWNMLVYEEDTLAGQEAVLASQLKEIQERYPSDAHYFGRS